MEKDIFILNEVDFLVMFVLEVFDEYMEFI